MLYCSECGELVKDHAKFCNKCGTKLANRKQNIKQTQRIYTGKSIQKNKPDKDNKRIPVICEECGAKSKKSKNAPVGFMILLFVIGAAFAIFTAGGSFAPLIGFWIGWKIFHSRKCKECGGKLVDL